MYTLYPMKEQLGNYSKFVLLYIIVVQRAQKLKKRHVLHEHILAQRQEKVTVLDGYIIPV